MPKLQLCLQPDQSLEQPHSGSLYPTLWPQGQESACEVSTKGGKQHPTLSETSSFPGGSQHSH